MKTYIKLFFTVLLFTFTSLIFAQNWTMKQAPLMTRWASQVDPKNPLPEYPRPQMVRDKWMNLNGIWQFKPGVSGDAVPTGKELSGSILVPFPVESAISGVMNHYDRIWYRRTFSIPTEWKDQRIILNFDAVDWESEIFVNGKRVGMHRGGYDPFSYDITAFLTQSDTQELIVRVFDPSENGGQPRGKQATAGIEIMYTPCTGIWQTVWLEPLPQTNISKIKIIPDIDASVLKLTANTNKSSNDLYIEATVKCNDTIIQSVTGNPNTEMSIQIPNAKLWTPQNPFLYDLFVKIKAGAETIDSVYSYFGMRKISVDLVDNKPKLLLNNNFVFQFGALDQGYWPDGNYTAPTDEALKFDLEQQKALGFNTIRKHVKVEPQRWYYWADKLGFLVWQDMPTAQSYGGVEADASIYLTELRKMVETHWNSPSIVMWTIYNEKCGQDVINKTYSTATLVNSVKQLDKTRIVNQASGYDWYGVGHVADNHTYPMPAATAGTASQAIVCGESGGKKYKIEGHSWGNGVVEVLDQESFSNIYESYALTLCRLKANDALSGAVFTQITDVEGEYNGLMTYDRDIYKIDQKKLKELNENVIYRQLSFKDILATSQNTNQSWKYTTNTPPNNWYEKGFNDLSWKNGRAPFASSGTPGIKVGTSWTTADIWIRKQFNPGVLSAEDVKSLIFNLYHDENCEIYINGTLAGSVTGYGGYTMMPIKQQGKDAIVPDSINTIAVHCHQTDGGQGIDVGIIKTVFSADTTAAYSPYPAHGATNINQDLTLKWEAGNFATYHKVYLGITPNLTDSNLLNTQTLHSYAVKGLNPNTPYYWRIDEVNDKTIVKGTVWSFTTKNITNIEDNLFDMGLKVTPIPVSSNGLLTVEVGGSSLGIERIELCSLTGKMLYTQKIESGKDATINISAINLSPGIYLINIIDRNKYYHHNKIIIK